MTQQPPVPPPPQWQPQQPPFSQPPYPPQQPPYHGGGYPQQGPPPPPGWGPPPPPRRTGGNGRMVGLVVALVVLVGGGGAVAVALSRHGGGSGGGPAATQGHYDPAKATFDPNGKLRGLRRAWGRADEAQNWAGVVADTIVSGGDTGVTAVDIRGGRPRWEWKSPAKMCTMTPGADGVYVVFRPTADGDCNAIAKLGADGRPAWQGQLPDSVGLSPHLSVGGRAGAETLVAAGGGGVDWIDSASGKVLYKLGPGTAPNGDFCTFVQALVGDLGVAMTTRCGWDIQNGPYNLHLYSSTVPPIRKFGGVQVPVNSDILSADGHVVVATAARLDGSAPAAIRSFTQDGRPTVSAADLELCATEATLYADILPSCRIVDADTLIVRSGQGRGLVAYDLGSGLRRWSRPAGPSDILPSVGALANGKLVVPNSTGRNHPGKMLLLDPRTGRQTGAIPVTGLPEEGGDTTIVTGGWVILLGRGITVYAPA
ncbi:MAG: PQQ-binding-like beta-propeller repeat protein [Mycobacteriales bacterium]